MKQHTMLRVLALTMLLATALSAPAQDKAAAAKPAPPREAASAAPADAAKDATKEAPTADQVREEYAYTVGVQAYLYGFAPVEMYRVRYRSAFDPGNPNRVPPNRFRHFRELLDASATVVVSPNNDTLYSSAWLDLSKEPVVLDVPDTRGRYYVMQFMDFFTNNFAYVGKRTTGTGAGSFAITGPGWAGALPAGVTRLVAPTNSVWLLGRTLVDGKDDLPAVRAVQDAYRLTPLSQWRQADVPVVAAAGAAAGAASTASAAPAPAAPPASSPGPAYDPANPLRFFEYLNAALRENPPPAREQVLMGVFAQIGVGPNQTFMASDLDPATARGLRRAIETGQRLIATLPSGRPVLNGWLGLAPNTGRYGDDFRYRAYTAKVGLAVNDPQESYSLTTVRDAQGQALSGTKRYVVRFEPGQLPPVKAFWSLTMYRLPGRFFADNPLARFAIGDRSRQLQRGADGSLEIYVQAESPGAGKESNWLPAPAGEFELALRCYMPDASISEGRWKPPAVKVVE